MKCDNLVTTTGTAPGQRIPYSDHEAIIATLCVKRRGEAEGSRVRAVGECPGCSDSWLRVGNLSGSTEGGPGPGALGIWEDSVSWASLL